MTLVAADLAGLPKEQEHPGNIHASLAIPYTVPNIRCSANWLAETPFKPSWIRTPGRMQNTFANESFLDELADAAGIDPLEFRLRNLNDARGKEVLERLAKLAGWSPRTGSRESGDVVHGARVRCPPSRSTSSTGRTRSRGARASRLRRSYLRRSRMPCSMRRASDCVRCRSRRRRYWRGSERSEVSVPRTAVLPLTLRRMGLGRSERLAF